MNVIMFSAAQWVAEVAFIRKITIVIDMRYSRNIIENAFISNDVMV